MTPVPVTSQARPALASSEEFNYCTFAQLSSSVEVRSAGSEWVIQDFRIVETTDNRFHSYYSCDERALVIATATSAEGRSVTVQRVLFGQLWASAALNDIHLLGRLLARIGGQPVSIYNPCLPPREKHSKQGAIKMAAWVKVDENLPDLLRRATRGFFSERGLCVASTQEQYDQARRILNARDEPSFTEQSLPRNMISVEAVPELPKRLTRELGVEAFLYTPAQIPSPAAQFTTGAQPAIDLYAPPPSRVIDQQDAAGHGFVSLS